MKTKLKALQGGGGAGSKDHDGPTMNEHELAVAKQANEELNQALRQLGAVRSSYVENENRAFDALAKARSKLSKVAEAALTARGLEVGGDWSIDFATGEMKKR